MTMIVLLYDQGDDETITATTSTTSSTSYALEEDGDVFVVDVVAVIGDVRPQHHLWQHNRHRTKRMIEQNDNDNNSNTLIASTNNNNKQQQHDNDEYEQLNQN
mmetsp:Transcript_43473/g.47150  ORF Transcript_43473/g.47150 Transcript_43473/m.47150 type:complete len:103 (+) Transcript_43473:186-494(+)